MNSLDYIIHSWKKIDTTMHTLCSDSTSFPREIEGLHGGMHGFFVNEYCKRSNDPIIIIVPDEKDAKNIIIDLQGVFDNGNSTYNANIYQLPWWGIVPYRASARGARVFGERASILAKLAKSSDKNFADDHSMPNIFVMTQRSCLTPVPPKDYIQSLLFDIHVTQSIDTVALGNRLAEQGYVRVPRVTVRGEYTIRGEVIDIFMPGEQYAHRIVFAFDEVESIKVFDTENQASVESLKSLTIYPMKEVIWTDELVEQLEASLKFLLTNSAATKRDFFETKVDKTLSELYVHKETEGEEIYYPLIFNNSIFDYISENSTVFFFDYDRQINMQENFEREYSALYKRSLDESFYPPPETQLLNFIDTSSTHTKSLFFRTIKGSNITNNERIVIECDGAKSFFGNINFLKESIEELQRDNWKIFIFADSVNQALRIEELLRDYICETPEEQLLFVIPNQISQGFEIPELKILVIQENEIFGRRKHTPKSVKTVKSAVIDTFVELNPDDFVVHVNYGIGLFKGIERVKVSGNERDYIKLEYYDNETVFIPIEQVNLVQRYIGNEGDAPKLDRLGSKSWENRKNKVKKSVEDIAEKLIELYAKRKAAVGFSFPQDSEFMTAFEANFPYTETEDQITVSEEIKADMEKPLPMDRLICGDVGYGKTEMAMRAAFKAVMGGKQVAFLAPTTILAEQHYESCLERFQDFPVTIAHMSRFVSKAEQKKILEKVTQGSVDILIGTHRIIQKDILFKDLGLMIIDEEQRFGVKDKERLKTLRTNIDSLAMSATPIPRTLHMSLLKIRDMSLLTTPPQNRQEIETVIDAYNEDRVAAAIRREAERGGQVFYLHNRVESLYDIQSKLQDLLPEMSIDIAHGQMAATELDDIFRRFKSGGFHVLIATTIIENGIDIPNVNTIIIDRADMYGVSQLYQLRGRVGRSDRKAYAYLLYPENRSLSEVAMKRLQVISDFTELGSGFKIAMKDMEIRGAGNLLGKDQSGDIYSVGFDLYLRLLEEAIEKLSDVTYEEQHEVLLELEYTGYIPEGYVSLAQTKMEIYKKIASIGNDDELEGVLYELEDRFGPIPLEVQSLLSLAKIRIICKKLYIATLKERMGKVQVEFSRVSNISVEKILDLIKNGEGKVALDPSLPNILLLETGKIDLEHKGNFIKEKLEALL